MSVATLTPRVREALSVSSDYDAATIPALIRRQINGLLRDYNFAKSLTKMETLVDVGDEAKVAFALPAGFKKEHLVVIYDPVTGLYGEPLKRREGLITGVTSPDYYWLEGSNLIINAGLGTSGLYVLVYYQSMDAATNEAWLTVDFEDVLFTRSVYRGAAEFQKPELASSFQGLWAEDQRSLAIYANELEFGGLDLVQRELRSGCTYNITGGVFAAGFSPYAALVARVDVLEATPVTNAQILAAIGYTPANVAGDAFTGAITATAMSIGANPVATQVYVTAAIAAAAPNLAPYALLASPVFTGAPSAPTPGTADNTTKIATTAYVKANLAAYAPLASPAFTGNPTAPTVAGSADTSTKIATTAFVQAVLAAVSGGGATTAYVDASIATEVTNRDNAISTAIATEVTNRNNAISAQAIRRDGTTSPTAAVAWGGQNLTGVAALSGGSYSFTGNGSLGGTLGVTGVATFSGTLVAATPNLGTTGGVRIAGNATSGLAVLQFVDATLATQWGYLDVTAAGDFVLGGTLTVTGNTHVTFGSTVKDSAGTDRLIGMLEMPPTATTGGRVFALADSGFCIVATGNMTIPTDAATNFPLGSMVGVYNDGGAPITIAAVTPGTTTVRLGASGSTGTRTLAVGGLCVFWKKAANYWVALNGGIS